MLVVLGKKQKVIRNLYFKATRCGIRILGYILIATKQRILHSIQVKLQNVGNSKFEIKKCAKDLIKLEHGKTFGSKNSYSNFPCQKVLF